MPIRFRCQHCHQFMGISRRKAGTKVQCPTCQKMVEVPTEDEVHEAAVHQSQTAGKAVPGANPAAVFERNDFDEVLRGSDARPAHANGTGAKKALESKKHEDADPKSASPEAAVSPQGVFVSHQKLTVLAVAGIILLALAFGAGLVVGKFCL